MNFSFQICPHSLSTAAASCTTASSTGMTSSCALKCKNQLKITEIQANYFLSFKTGNSDYENDYHRYVPILSQIMIETK